jgi:hypothetical protein
MIGRPGILLAIAVLMLGAFAVFRSLGFPGNARGGLDRKKAEALIRASPAFGIPAGARTLKRVSGVVIADDGRTADAEFEWYFSNGPAGVAGETMKSTARFRLYDDGWRVDEAALAASVGGVLPAK